MSRTIIVKNVVLEGRSPIMFDRYPGDNKTKLEPEQKMYFLSNEKINGNGRTVVLPMANIRSFLTAQNTDSATKRVLPPKEYKKVAQNIQSFVSVTPDEIIFQRDGKPIKFYGFVDDVDEKGGLFVHHSVARLAKGIPNEKHRPVINLPWSLSFQLQIYPHQELRDELLRKIFDEGGMSLGLGTFRGVFGKFTVASWENEE